MASSSVQRNGLRLRDPLTEPLRIHASVIDDYIFHEFAVCTPSDEQRAEARSLVGMMLARVEIIKLPRVCVRLGKFRLIIEGDDICWIGPRERSGVPFYRRMTTTTGAAR